MGNLKLVPTRQQGRGLEDAICISSCQLCIKWEVIYQQWWAKKKLRILFSAISYWIDHQLCLRNNNHWMTGWLLTWCNNNLNLKQLKLLETIWNNFQKTELVLRHWLIMAVSTLVVVSTLMAGSTLQMLLL